MFFFLFFLVYCVRLAAYFSQNGLHGEILFDENRNENFIEIQSKLETTLQYPEQTWKWSIHEMPIDYTEINPNRRCHSSRIGKKLFEFNEYLGFLQLPGNESTTWNFSKEYNGNQNYITFCKANSYTNKFIDKLNR